MANVLKQLSEEQQLAQRAEHWLKSSMRCPFVVAYPRFQTQHGEAPHVLGFWPSGRTVLIHIVVSQQAFARDRKKKYRRNSILGIGTERFYLTDLKVLPCVTGTGWGLLSCWPDRVLRVESSKAFQSDFQAERNLLFSLLKETV